MTQDHRPDVPPETTVADLGERRLIARIQTQTPAAPTWVHVAIGDDAAVVEPARNTLDVLTTDAMVEGVHFDRRLMTLGDVGHKLLAVSLSDLAAMGATPRTALLSLVLPGNTRVADLDALVASLVALATTHHVALVGGNIARSPGPLVADVTATGAVRRRRVLRRDGVRPGDELYVSGHVGSAAAGLAWLQRTPDTTTTPEPALSAAVGRFRRPEPRLRLGTLLGRNRAASACIDLSDGLGAALHQLAEASGVGFAIDGDVLPIDAGVAHWLASQQIDPVDLALSGGEDYELAFTVARKRRGRLRHVRRLIGDLTITRIGEATTGPDVVVRRAGHAAPIPTGFVHF